MIRIDSLHVYPVKSCRGISLDRARITPTGIAHDREWMIVTPEGRFVTQREVPRLALIDIRLEAAGLLLNAPGCESLEVARELDGELREVVVWKDRVQAIDAGDAAAAWLSRFLERDTRLVRFGPHARRPSDAQWTQGLAAFSRFADAFALLTISAASLDDLNSRLHKPLPMNRFRPNLVLSGLDPYGEDRVHELAADSVRLRAVKACTRCAITTTDQDSGRVDGAEPLRTLRTYRWSSELRGVKFGQNLIVLGEGELEVGMPLETSWRQ